MKLLLQEYDKHAAEVLQSLETGKVTFHCILFRFNSGTSFFKFRGTLPKEVLHED